MDEMKVEAGGIEPAGSGKAENAKVGFTGSWTLAICRLLP
jgi:hypothetical protein